MARYTITPLRVTASLYQTAPVTDTVAAKDGLIKSGASESGGMMLLTVPFVAVESKWRGAAFLVAIALCCAVISGCSTPVSVERVDPRTSYENQDRNVLSSGSLSEPTRIVLTRWGLAGQFETDPAGSIVALQHRLADHTGGDDEVYALAELSFYQAERTKQRSYYLAASVYAFAYLFPQAPDTPPNAYDPRLRAASDIYDRGLILAFETPDKSRIDFRSGEFALPCGTLRVDFDPASTVWANRRLVNFIPIGEFEVHGLLNRYRQEGVGAPLAATPIPLKDEKGFQLGRQVKVAVTAVLRIQNARAQIAAGSMDATLEIHPPSTLESVRIGGQTVPLEIERTAALAYTLSDKQIWASELRGFFLGDLLTKMPTRLGGITPYQPGRFPVVLVHGTASSAGRWGDMVNELLSDPRIRNHFQFWLFTYDTGNPIQYSSLLLREAIRNAVAKVDPEGKDLALRQMVVIGHSQGGLLAKMLAVDSGSKFWDSVSRKPLDQMRMSDDTRGQIRRTMFFDHSPYVSRVIFIATPHKGSYLAGYSLAKMVASFIKTPLQVLDATKEVLTNNPDTLMFDPTKHAVGNSIYGMTPGSPFITTLDALPIAPGITVHSIVGVNTSGPVESGDDGVVAYSSAHYPAAVSELVVQSGHSMQAAPATINEVRRILLLHLKEACAVDIRRPNALLVSAAACQDDAAAGGQY